LKGYFTLIAFKMAGQCTTALEGRHYHLNGTDIHVSTRVSVPLL